MCNVDAAQPKFICPYPFEQRQSRAIAYGIMSDQDREELTCMWKEIKHDEVMQWTLAGAMMMRLRSHLEWSVDQAQGEEEDM